MIRSKYDLYYYWKEDKKALGISRKWPRLIGDEIWGYQRYLRLIEYLERKDSFWANIVLIFAKLKKRHLGMMLGFEISSNTFGPGLAIMHRGPIIILNSVRIGSNCRIHTCVNIGSTKGTGKGAQLGDNCYIGPGVQIVGPVVIADNITIGAGAVVTKSFLEPNVVIAGVPAKIIKRKAPITL